MVSGDIPSVPARSSSPRGSPGEEDCKTLAKAGPRGEARGWLRLGVGGTDRCRRVAGPGDGFLHQRGLFRSQRNRGEPLLDLGLGGYADGQEDGKNGKPARNIPELLMVFLPRVFSRLINEMRCSGATAAYDSSWPSTAHAGGIYKSQGGLCNTKSLAGRSTPRRLRP